MARLTGWVLVGIVVLMGFAGGPANAADLMIEPTTPAVGEVATVAGLPASTEIGLELIPSGDAAVISFAEIVSTEGGLVSFVVPQVSPGDYTLVASWIPVNGDVQESARTPISVLPAATVITAPPSLPPTSPGGGGSTPLISKRITPRHRMVSAPTPDEDLRTLGFQVVADPELSLWIDVALVIVALVVLGVSPWVRAIVVDSLLHPRTKTWLHRDGKKVRISSEAPEDLDQEGRWQSP